MKFSHRMQRRGDRLLDVLTDEERGLRLIISRLGAELVSLARRDGQGNWVGFLYRDGEVDPPGKGWANHATVMGYYLHRLKDGKSLYRGHEIRGGTHSFLRAKVWALAEASPGSLTYRITPDDFEKSEYPLNVSLDLSYAIEGEKVRVTFHFHNGEPEVSAHIGFGLHPGFAAATFESFSLEMPAGTYRRHLAPDNFLSGAYSTFS
jgi:galactose mutarotase-like enzyme